MRTTKQCLKIFHFFGGRIYGFNRLKMFCENLLFSRNHLKMFCEKVFWMQNQEEFLGEVKVLPLRNIKGNAESALL